MSAPQAGDRIVIVDYDSRWPALFERERARIQAAIAAFAVSVEHIGSTSVPGLCAKPIVDTLVTVARFGPPELYVPILAALGYTFLDAPDNTDRHAFRRREAQGQRLMPGYNLHIVRHGSPVHQRNLAFRDYLRAHPEAAAEYCALKRQLAASYGPDHDGYTNAKTTFVRGIEAKCL